MAQKYDFGVECQWCGGDLDYEELLSAYCASDKDQHFEAKCPHCGEMLDVVAEQTIAFGLARQGWDDPYDPYQERRR